MTTHFIQFADFIVALEEEVDNGYSKLEHFAQPVYFHENHCWKEKR